jgi:phosphohistidine phosphatase
MIIYVVRHAIAEQRKANSTEQEDSQRPLTDEGRKKMGRIARGLKETGVQIDLILSSPYIRAVDTARILHRRLNLDKGKLVVMDNLSPVGDPRQLVREINERFSAVNNIALVGHEPGLSRLTAVLLSGDPTLPITLKKGGVCELSVEKLEYGRCATLEWLLAPAHLVEISGYSS